MRAVLFDMDGVLVDVSLSYRMTVKKVIEHYLKKPYPVSKIQEFKNRGNLNNDWDLSEVVLEEHGIRVQKQELIDIFQDIYLGDNFNGLIKNEKWLLKKEKLEEIKKSFKTGIVTGRPRMETDYVLNRFGVEVFFSVTVTMDDLPPEKGKPDPLGIRMALAELECSSAFYAGDTVDDMVAACRAKVVPIGVFNGHGDKEMQKSLLLKNGAREVLDDVNDILEVLNG